MDTLIWSSDTPTAYTEEGYRFKIYFNDHAPAHVHVQKAEKEARVTLVSTEVVSNEGFNSRELSRIIGNPLDWHPWLAHATSDQQKRVEPHAYSVDWTDLDEGLDIQGMLMGIRPRYPMEAKLKS